MKKIILTPRTIKRFEKALREEEKTQSTINKYIHDIQFFYNFLNEDKIITKDSIIQYKQTLMNTYKATSVNSMLVALNRFLDFLDLTKCKVKLNKIQKETFHDDNKEMTKEEYKRLLKAASHQNNKRLYMLIQTICATGIRVSEHKYITVEAIKHGKATVINKGKIRHIYLPKELKKMLMRYCHENRITSGSVFITKNGRPMDRSNIWSSMKSLCKDANIDSQKVFPHNLRHLFAITYYRIEKDLDTLASLLGHTSVDTTRIYTMTSSRKCIQTLSRMNLCYTS